MNEADELELTASPAAVAAWRALSPTERGQIVERWYATTAPNLKLRYKRERYSLAVFDLLLVEAEKAVSSQGMTLETARLIRHCKSVEGYLTANQVTDAVYPAMKARLDLLSNRARVYFEVLSARHRRRR